MGKFRLSFRVISLDKYIEKHIKYYFFRLPRTDHVTGIGNPPISIFKFNRIYPVAGMNDLGKGDLSCDPFYKKVFQDKIPCIL